MTDVARLSADESESWDGLAGAFAAFDAGTFETPGLTPDGWSAKVAMYHVAAWQLDCAHQLAAMRLGTFDGRIDTITWIEEQNRRQFERARALPADEARASVRTARARMLEEWAQLPQVTPIAVEWFEESGALHYRTHAEDLRRWSSSLRGSASTRP